MSDCFDDKRLDCFPRHFDCYGKYDAAIRFAGTEQGGGSFGKVVPAVAWGSLGRRSRQGATAFSVCPDHRIA